LDIKNPIRIRKERATNILDIITNFLLNPKLKRAYCHSDYPDCDLRFVTNAVQSRNKSACFV
jgi:hypothetical protein